MSPRKPALPALALVTLSLLALAPGASAAPQQLGCRAVALSALASGSSSVFEPTAQDHTPCASAQATNAGPASSGAIRAGAAAAFTHAAARHEAPGAGSFASLTNTTISGGGHVIAIADAQAQASYTCVAGSVISNGTSQVSGVSIDGKPVPVLPATRSLHVTIDNHGSFLMLNDFTSTSGLLDRTAAFVHLAGVGDYTIADASVTTTASPCGRTPRPAAIIQPCPAGSNYDPVRMTCEITDFTKRPIVVASPFAMLTAGTVQAVGHARATYTGAHCLGRRGPSYAIVATPGPGSLVAGSGGADRIVVLGGNYTIDGNGGKDCISLGGGADAVRDGNARVRIFGGAGSEKISLGNGNNRIVSGAGVVQITAGNGRNFIRLGAGHHTVKVGNGANTIYGGTGFDQIRAGNGANTIIASPGVEEISVGSGASVIQGSLGFDRIFARGAGAQVRCGAGRDQVTVNPAAVAYARHHGCTTVVGKA